MFAFIWVQAGFAMVITAAGLASIPRDTLEAARTDGASEWQVFRRITIPLLAPVLTVVFVTQIIGVLKLFDLILSIAPGSTQDDAATLAFVEWQVSFSGQNRFGLGAAIATFILDPLHPLPDRQHPALPGGHELMATVDTSRSRPPSIPTRASRPGSSASSARTPIHIVLALIAHLLAGPDHRALHHLAADAVRRGGGRAGGTSSRSRAPGRSRTTRNMFDNEGITHALWVTVHVTIGATILPILVAALAAYALAWIDFPGRDWLFLLSSGSCSCRSRWR